MLPARSTDQRTLVRLRCAVRRSRSDDDPRRSHKHVADTAAKVTEHILIRVAHQRALAVADGQMRRVIVNHSGENEAAFTGGIDQMTQCKPLFRSVRRCLAFHRAV